MNEENSYRISFFKPTTDRAKTNRNMVLWLISIWAVGIFGFHILLRIIEKPIPEPELISFNEVWENVKSGNASSEELRVFSNSALHVAGKVFISASDRAAIDNGISWAVYQLADSMQQLVILNALSEFEMQASKNLSVNDEAYILAKSRLSGLVNPVLGISPSNVLSSILPLELKLSGVLVFSDENKKIVQASMSKYLIHNRSVLTDTKFLGFPFHYFYSAVFLLVLFIGLCYAYCISVDRYNKRMGIAD